MMLSDSAAFIGLVLIGVAFFVIIITGAAANLYRNDVLTLEQVESFPLRSP